MPKNPKPIEQMTISELEQEQKRNHRLINVDLVIAIQYDSNVPLTDELKAYFERIPEIAHRLREAIVDNIKIEDIPKIWPWKISIKEVLEISKPIIKNRSDFAKFMIMDGWN